MYVFIFFLKIFGQAVLLDFKFIAGVFVCLHFAEPLLFADNYDY